MIDTWGTRPLLRLKLLLALAAAIAAAGLSAVAASPASAFISEETCTESWQTCDEEPSGGAMGDGSAVGDAGAAGDAGGSSVDTAAPVSADNPSSSFDPKNDGLDPDPFEDPLKPQPGDKLFGILKPGTPEVCDTIFNSLGASEERLDMLVGWIRDPSTYEDDPILFPPLSVAISRRAWRRRASEERQQIRHYRALYENKSCDSILVGGD